MALITDLSDSSPMALDGQAFFEVVDVAQQSFETPTEVISSLGVCDTGCDCASCCYTHQVFGESVFSTEKKNDKFMFFGIAREDSGNVTFTLQKDETDLVAISDQSLGDWTDAGGYSANLRLATFYADWGKIFRAYGEGEYRIKVETDAIGGGTNTEYSDNFQVNPYDNSFADNTVVFEWTQNGIILNNSINFTGLNITQYLRVPGNIGFDNNPELRIEEHETAPHEFVQVQDQLLMFHTYESKLLPFSVTSKILNDLLLANEITVTNYNYYDHWVINQKKLKPENIEDFQSYPYNKCAKLKIKFSEKIRNTIKRNYT